MGGASKLLSVSGSEKENLSDFFFAQLFLYVGIAYETWHKSVIQVLKIS